MFYQVRPKQMDSWLAQFAGQAPLPLVLDVREPWECEVVRLPEDARFAQAFIPMGDIPARWQDALDPQRPIACLCHHGMRSQSVAAFLVQHGFEAVANITGGISAWSRELDASVPQY